MKAIEINQKSRNLGKFQTVRLSAGKIFPAALVALFLAIGTASAFAHCDSYDGPTIKDALKALETNNVDLVLKWISEEQEADITNIDPNIAESIMFIYASDSQNI
ncbi:MAG: DUF6448 family protein [Tannerella sp.]|nr:DUF6448 family protein [Tannerella sp.]